MYSQLIRTQVCLRLGAGCVGATKSIGGGISSGLFGRIRLSSDRLRANKARFKAPQEPGILRLAVGGMSMSERRQLKVVLASLFLILGFFASGAVALTTDQAITITADRLANDQITYGAFAGIWPDEADFTGSIVAGMVDAYEAASSDAYRASAELGADYILWSAQGNFFGDEAYALTRLSQVAADPNNNTWRTAIEYFYAAIKSDYPGGTQGYINAFAGIDPSTAVFYMANHVIAAYYVDAADKELWRQELIRWLSRVDDSSLFPVMALGVATWALAQTGPLDNSLIIPSGEGAPYWDGKMLKDLPNLLLSHQVAEGQPGAGSFYWQFTHSDGDLNNCTEDTIFATLGLLSTSQVSPSSKLDSAILAAREALLGGVSSEGKVWERLSRGGAVYYAYAGEMLQVLKALKSKPILGDVNGDGQVDLADFEILINQWGASDCVEPSWCEGADINKDGKVDSADLEILLDVWDQDQ